jgi:hypothetical protein
VHLQRLLDVKWSNKHFPFSATRACHVKDAADQTHPAKVDLKLRGGVAMLARASLANTSF